MMDNYYNLISEFPETRHLRDVEQMRDEARGHIDAHSGETVPAAATPVNANVPMQVQNTTTTTNGN